MNFRVIATSAALLSAFGIAGCGGSSSNNASTSSSSNGPQLLAATFTSNHPTKVTSADVAISLKGNISGGTGPTGSADVTADIAFNKAKSGTVPDFAALAKIGLNSSKGSDTNLQVGGTYVDGRLYVAYQPNGSDTLTNYDAGSEISKRITESLIQAEQKSTAGAGTTAGTLSKFGLEPGTWLKNSTVAGSESIGGVDTYKITGDVDLAAMVPNLLKAATTAQSLTGDTTKVPTVTQAQIDAVTKQVKTLKVTIWTGKDDHILRQAQVDLDWKGEHGQAASGQLKITLTKVNEQQDIKAPSDTQPITDLITQLGPLLSQLQAGGGLSSLTGGSSSSSSSATSGASGTSPATAAATAAYAKCMAAAADSTTNQQKCLALLTGQ